MIPRNEYVVADNINEKSTYTIILGENGVLHLYTHRKGDAYRTYLNKITDKELSIVKNNPAWKWYIDEKYWKFLSKSKNV